jgi:excisionase family DNA binding protein
MTLLTTQQLAAKLGVTDSRVRQWIRDGRLKPAATLPSGDHLFRAGTKRPKELKRGRPASG